MTTSFSVQTKLLNNKKKSAVKRRYQIQILQIVKRSDYLLIQENLKFNRNENKTPSQSAKKN